MSTSKGKVTELRQVRLRERKERGEGGAGRESARQREEQKRGRESVYIKRESAGV